MTNKVTVHQLETTQSTNEYANYLLNNDIESAPFMVVTRCQTAGKGQGQNIWESQNYKNLLCSLVYTPKKISVEQQFLISKIASVSICEILKKRLDNNISIKWPNDIYVGYQKICGILIENSILGEHIAHTIIGIGLNINQKKFPKNIPNPTSMFLETQQLYSIDRIREELTERILQNFEQTEKVSQKYDELLLLKNKISLFQDNYNTVFKGKIQGINEIGQLIIHDLDNDVKKVFSNQEVKWILA